MTPAEGYSHSAAYQHDQHTPARVPTSANNPTPTTPTALSLHLKATPQWVETNQSNFHIYPTDIHLSPPHGTMLTAYVDVRTDVGGC
jgi:hypothetical protein